MLYPTELLSADDYPGNKAEFNEVVANRDHLQNFISQFFVLAIMGWY
jgi:hypothetical protein